MVDSPSTGGAGLSRQQTDKGLRQARQSERMNMTVLTVKVHSTGSAAALSGLVGDDPVTRDT